MRGLLSTLSLCLIVATATRRASAFLRPHYIRSFSQFPFRGVRCASVLSTGTVSTGRASYRPVGIGPTAMASSAAAGQGAPIAELRKEYSTKGLDEVEVPEEPFALFRQWLSDAMASQVIEPNAMCLSTVGKDGRPSARFVLLKGLDDRGFVFYTNYESRKSQELQAHPFAALTFWWGDLERSVRIEGVVEKVEEEESSAYFASRPRGSQMGAWASNQSRPIGSREELDKQLEGVKERFSDESEPVPRPPHWGGWRLVPDRIEFWKGRQSRVHDRLVYQLKGEESCWTLQRLQP